MFQLSTKEQIRFASRPRKKAQVSESSESEKEWHV